MKTLTPSVMLKRTHTSTIRQTNLSIVKIFMMLMLGLSIGLHQEIKAQVNIIPIRTDVSDFSTWTDNSVAGTTYLQLLVANASTITPVMNFDSYSNESLTFTARTFGGITPAENTITVSISTDNGNSWTILGTRTPASTTPTAVTAFDLSSYNGTQVKIKFYVEGTSNTIGAGIDDIAITGIPGNIITTTTPISGAPFCVTPGSAAVSVPFTISGTYNSGNFFTAQLSNSTGSFTTPTNIGTLTSTTAGTIAATIPSGTIAGAGYIIRIISSNPAVTGSSTAAFTIATTVVPAVTISASATTICSGSSVTFTPTPTNGGTPTYQWKVNGSNATTGSTYTTSSLVNGDIVSCVMTSTAPCASPATATSGNITMTVNPLPADPTGTITPAANPSCTNTTLTFSNAAASVYWETSTSGTSTANPSTSPLTVSTSGTYYVRGYNGNCWSSNSLSSPAITVNIAPSITTQPTDKTTTEPATATFAVTAAGTGLTYQWQISTNAGGSWSDISGATSSSYTTPATTQTMNGYQYHCIINGSSPCIAITTNAAILTVLEGAMWTNPITGTDPSTSNPFTTGQTFNSNITVSGISRGSGITAATVNDRYSASGWNSATLNTNDYFEFTLTPNAGYQINFINFVYTGQASGTGPISVSFRSGLDAYSANIGTATVTGTTISLSGAAYQGITAAITFRFYGWGASGVGGTFSINDFTFNGTVIPAGSTLTATPSALTGFTYSIGFGPSPAQPFNLTGILLNGSNVVLTPSTNYEISLSNAPFTPTNPITLAAFNGTSTPVYVRLKAGLPVTTYNGEIISITGGGDTDGATVTCSGSVTNPIPTVTLADNGTQITPANVLTGTTNLILHKFQLGITVANAALTGMTCTTAGTYVTGSLTNLKAWYSTNATFESGTDVLLSTLTTPGIGGSKTFPAFIAQTINAGSTGYIFITADISASAISGNTINVNAIAVSNLTFTSATVSGTTNAGGLQTIIKPEPTNQVTAFSCGTATANTLSLSWTPAASGSQAPDGYLILWSEGAITAPADNVAQANGTGVYNITSAATASYIVTGLTANTSYNFQIWSYTNSGTSINYNLTAPPASSCTTIDGPCLSEGFTGFASGTRAAGWAFTGFSNTTVYTTAPFIGASSPSLKMENTGDQVVTAAVSNAAQLSFWIYGNGSPTTDKLLVEGLNGSVWTTIDNITPPASAGVTKTYNAGSTPALASGFTQFRFTYTSTSINLGFDDVTVYCTTCTPPTTQATSFSANTITSTSMNIAFTRGNGDGGVMVVARAGTAPTDPASGFTYTASSAFGNGAACGSGFVVYNGTASGINAASGNIAITNLAPSTTYHFAVYEYNAADDCYYLSELTGNATTLNTTATRLLFSIQPTTSGINLTMTPEVKVQAVDANGFVDVTFTGTITLTSTGTMTGPVTATAVNGIATFSSIVHTVLGTGHTLTATYAAWTPVVSTPFDIVVSTTFAPGDLIFIGYDALVGGAPDKIYILNMIPINPGTKFQFVNSRFEAGAAAGVRTMKWCGGSDDPNVLPAVIDITYNGAGAIAAGSIISFTIDYATPLAYWINNVVSTAFSATGAEANLTSTSGSGDQLYLTQGTFTNYGTYALFSGSVLYGMTITTPWVPLTDACSAGTTGGATRESRLHPDLECFNLAVGNDKYGFYKNSSLHEGSKREILVAIMGITNWEFGFGTTPLDVLEDYDTPWNDPSGTGVSLGKPFTITAASNAPDGTWVGDNTTFPNDWFYCGNWQGLAVPSENDDVYIPSNAVGYCDVNVSSVHAPKFSYIAKCKNIRMEGTSGNYYLSLKGDTADRLEVYGNLTITGNGLLDMAGGSAVDGEISLFGNWINNRGTSGFMPGKGTIKMVGSIPQSISSMALTEYFSHLTINHSSTGVTLLNDCWVADVLTLTKGKVHTGVNYMNVTSTNPTSVIGHYTDQSLGTYTLSSYVNGNLRRSVAATGTYDFPVGTPLYYELAKVDMNASSGVSYLSASFKTPADGSAPNVTVDGSLVDILLNAGYWIISPDAAVSVNYDVTASSAGHSNGGGPASSYTLLKRASSLDNWASLGTHNNATQTLYGSGASEVITAKRTAYTGFSHFAIAKSSVGPLPVEMLSFEALCEPKAVEIRWSTASESNNDFFTIDRSTDAKTYHQIAEVKGAGNSNKLLQYSFLDTDPLQGISYYRLSQRDYDGRSETFDPISSQCSSNNDEAFRLVNVANNGTEPQIAYYISTNAQVSVCVYDVTGRRIDCFEHTGEAGFRMIDLDINAGAGLYLVSLTDGSRVLSTKVLIR